MQLIRFYFIVVILAQLILVQSGSFAQGSVPSPPGTFTSLPGAEPPSPSGRPSTRPNHTCLRRLIPSPQHLLLRRW